MMKCGWNGCKCLNEVIDLVVEKMYPCLFKKQKKYKQNQNSFTHFIITDSVSGPHNLFFICI